MSDAELTSLGACPNCGGKFETLKVSDVTIDRCLSCQGLWLDARELETVLASDHHRLTGQRQSGELTSHPTDKKGPCPRCGGGFIRLTDLRANVATDSCSVCYGIFLDAGELVAYDHPQLTAQVGKFLRRLIGKD